uniref:Uncharacterized protein n=1 Tax=Rhizophora mucronata TaxID=61149 RepID=A0A2P2QHK8_RHIMU
MRKNRQGRKNIQHLYCPK